jgi:hypothetical protein
MYRKEMNLLGKKDAQNASFIKLLAHILGIGACSSFSLFVFGMGVPDFLKPGTDGFVTFSLFLLVPMIGYVITWFHERTGALIMLAGAIALMIYHFYYGDLSMGFVFGLPFLICALLFLWHTKGNVR